MSRIHINENRLSLEWVGISSPPSDCIRHVSNELIIQLGITFIYPTSTLKVQINNNYYVDINFNLPVRKGALLIVHCEEIFVAGKEATIHVFGEEHDIPYRWQNCIFYTDRGLGLLSSAFVEVILGWVEDGRRTVGRQLLQTSAGKLVFANEQIRTAQERVFFDLQHPPKERERILWIFANPYIDLLAGPYGLEILDGICRDAGFATRITNPFVEFLQPIQGLQQLIEDFKPDLIGISLRNIDDALIVHSLEGEPESIDTLNLLLEVKHLIQSLHAFEGPIFIGGAAFGTAPELLLRYFQLDFGVIGAGEAAIQQLCQLWKEDKFRQKSMKGFLQLWSGLPGGAWIENEVYRQNPASATRLLEQSPYIRRTWAYTYKNKRDYLPEPVRSSQGCALGCSYCIESVNRKAMSWRTIQQVVDEMEFSLHRYGIRIFHLADSEANIPFQRFIDLAEEVLARNLQEEILWTAYLNVRPFDPQVIPLLQRAGLYRFKFAVDHFDNSMLRSYHKNFREKDIQQLLDGFEPYLDQVQLYAGVLLGGPGETEDTMHYAVQRMKDYSRKGISFYYNVGVRVYPGTPFGEGFLREPEASEYYGPGKADGGISPLVYCSPRSPRILARELERMFSENPRVFRMNKERTTAIGYEGYRRFIIAWHAWLDGRYQEAEHILATTEGLHLLKEGLVLQRLLRMRKRYIAPFRYVTEEVVQL